nr:diiron oxygenase [Virgisporangium aurantiacum]
MVGRQETAERLLTASVRRSYDPAVTIDWAAPFVDGAYWLPPERSSLYGTPLWAGLRDDQRIELTKHEVASAASAGIWFETVLMQMLIRAYYDQDPTSPHAQYALTEVADECRHSIMFGRLIERLGVEPTKARWRDHTLGRFLKATATGPHMYAAILIAEEILDAFQREIAADESLQPLIRMVSHIHVVEEARHVKYAREELARQVENAGPVTLAYSRMVIARAAASVVSRLVHPDVYRSVGIDPSIGRRAALANPQFRATLSWSASKAVAYLESLNLIDGPSRRIWRRAHLI